MNRDGTGPEGKGPLTGRGLGDCKEINVICDKSIDLLNKLDKIPIKDFKNQEEILEKLDELRVRLEIIVLENK